MAEFVAWRVDLTEARLLKRGFTLKVIRAARKARFEASLAAGRSAGFETSTAYDAYIAFRDRLRVSKNALLDELPVLLEVVKQREFYVANIRNCDEDGPIRGALYGKSEDDLWLIVMGFLASEFSDEMALALGDTTEVRLFALRILLCADSFNRRPRKMKGPAKVRAELAQIAKLSVRLHSVMQQVDDSRFLIKEALSEDSPPSLQWSQLTTLLEKLSASASRAASEVSVRKGRVSNATGNYTPLMMIADAWMLSFGVTPSAAPRSRFMSVAGYCLLLFTHGTVDVRAGLKYWKSTAKARRHLGDEFLVANLSIHAPPVMVQK